MVEAQAEETSVNTSLLRSGVESFSKFDICASLPKPALSKTDSTLVDPIDALRRFLDSCAPGPVQDKDSLVSLLTESWDSFPGSNEQSMAPWKLTRLEHPEWDPPVLRFCIERHGGTVMGSTRAEMQSWVVNMDEMTASCSEDGYRQLQSRDAPVNVEPLAERVAQLISSGGVDPCLRWTDSTHVQVVISAVVSGHFKRTVEGRRKRFREALERKLASGGWMRVPGKRNVYEKK